MKLLSQLMDLSGRKALVVGGAGHIGWSTVETLTELGATLSILDLPSACEDRASDLSRLKGHDVAAIGCDLRDEKATRAAVNKALDNLGGLEILVHCAAYTGVTEANGWAVPFERQTVEAWDAALRVNLTSPFMIAQEARQALDASGHGSIIVFASIYGVIGPELTLYQGTGMANPTAYGASKGGLLQLTRYLATMLAPGVRVNAISPGGVWRGQPESFHEQYLSRTPLKRMASEQDLKGAFVYLASDMSEYVTGHNLVVDGGWTAW